jgi:hypothetical protein
MLSPTFMLATAVLTGVPNLPPPAPAPAGEEIRQPAPEEGRGGPFEPVEEQTVVVVEAGPAEAPRPFTIAPDPELERRYAPREPASLNRITIPFRERRQ